MRKVIKSVAALLALLCVALSFTGCGGPQKPTAKDAQDYVKAVLDALCKGTYDKSVNLSDGDELIAMREGMIENMIYEMEFGLSDEQLEAASATMFRALSKCKYTVGTATPVDGAKGEYDVEVTIEPLKLLGDDYETLLTNLFTEIFSDMMALLTMSEEEQTGLIIDKIFEAVDEALDDPSYGEPVSFTVRYEELEEGVYGCSEEEGAKMGKYFFEMPAELLEG